MECLPSAQSRAAHSMVSRRGAGLAWSSISDLDAPPQQLESTVIMKALSAERAGSRIPGAAGRA